MRAAAPSRPRLFARERTADRALLWRMSAWSGVAVTALIVAFVIARSPIAARHGALADANAIMAAQAKQLQQIIRQGDSEQRRLAAALETLNADRDRLFARVTELERDVQTVTGSVTKLATAPPPATPAPPPPAVEAPQSVPVAGKPAAALPPAQDHVVAADAPKPDAVKPDTHKPGKPELVAAIAPTADIKPPPDSVAAEKTRTEKSTPAAAPEAEKVKAEKSKASKLPLGIDLGSASSIEGLRAIWDSTRNAHAASVEGLQPIITIHEPKNGLGMQLRLVAGPVPDAASVAKRCAALIEATRPCVSATYDGQRLTPREAGAAPPARAKPTRAARSEAKVPAPAPKPKRSGFSLFGNGND